MGMFALNINMLGACVCGICWSYVRNCLRNTLQLRQLMLRIERSVESVGEHGCITYKYFESIVAVRVGRIGGNCSVTGHRGARWREMRM